MANALLYGFMQLKDLADTRAITLDPNLMISAVTMSRQQHDQEVAAFMNLFAEETTAEQLKFNGSALTRNQPLDEFGRSRPIKPSAPYTVGFPIHAAGNAYGANFTTNAKMTVQQVNDLIGLMYYGDFAWMRDHVMATLYDNVGWTFADPIVGNVAVKGLANADAVTYVKSGGAAAPATDTHYLFSANAIGNGAGDNPFPTIYAELTEHPENGPVIIAFVNTSNVAAIKLLTDFTDESDPDVTLATSVSRLTGRLDVTLPASAQVIGKTDLVWIVEWSAAVPADYIVAVAVGGTPPLKMRIDEEAELRGFKPVATRDDFPYFESQWFRRAGFGAWNRVGAVVCKVGAGSYTIPTGFTSPMP